MTVFYEFVTIAFALAWAVAACKITETCTDNRKMDHIVFLFGRGGFFSGGPFFGGGDPFFGGPYEGGMPPAGRGPGWGLGGFFRRAGRRRSHPNANAVAKTKSAKKRKKAAAKGYSFTAWLSDMFHGTFMK